MKRIPLWFISLAFVAACSTAPKKVVEAPPSYQSTPQSTPLRMGIEQAPKLVEVQDAVKRVFKEAAVIDTTYNPNFLVGDFNGDASQDIAVILKPVNLDE